MFLGLRSSFLEKDCILTPLRTQLLICCLLCATNIPRAQWLKATRYCLSRFCRPPWGQTAGGDAEAGVPRWPQIPGPCLGCGMGFSSMVSGCTTTLNTGGPLRAQLQHCTKSLLLYSIGQSKPGDPSRVKGVEKEVSSLDLGKSSNIILQRREASGPRFWATEHHSAPRCWK